MDARKIFISYRRADARADAGRLYDRLEARYPGRVFRDVGSLEPGVEWRDAIDAVLASTAAFIVVIGPGWLNAADADGKRRIDDARDEVRKEVAVALKNGIRVFPVLVGGARMPAVEELPEDVRPLVRRNALELTEQDFDEGVNKLEHAIERTPGWTSPSRSSAARLATALAVFALFAALAVTYTLRQRSDGPSPAMTTRGGAADRSSTSAPARAEPPRSDTSGVTPSVGQIALTWKGVNAVNWYVLDGSRKTLRSARVGGGRTETVDIAPGNYFVTLGGSPEYAPVAVTVTAGRASGVIPPVGQIVLTWKGVNSVNWHVLDASKKTLRNERVGAGQTATVDIAPGNYFVALGGSPERAPAAVTVTAGHASSVSPPVGQIALTWKSVNSVNWNVLDASKKTLRNERVGAGQTATLDIAPGNYFVALGGSPEIKPIAVTVSARQPARVSMPR